MRARWSKRALTRSCSKAFPSDLGRRVSEAVGIPDDWHWRGPGLRRSGAGLLRLSGYVLRGAAEVRQALRRARRRRARRHPPLRGRGAKLRFSERRAHLRQCSAAAEIARGRNRREVGGGWRPADVRAGHRRPVMSLTVHDSVAAFRAASRALATRAAGRLGFVPTMGALHEGHLRAGRMPRGAAARRVAVSIFVNPDAVRPERRLFALPAQLRTRSASSAGSAASSTCSRPASRKCTRAGEQTRVSVRSLTDGLCGPNRPGHFEGVATIVSKLFLRRRPVRRRVRTKDYQQLTGDRADGEGPLFPGRGRRRADRARAGRPRAVIAQRLPVARRALALARHPAALAAAVRRVRSRRAPRARAPGPRRSCVAERRRYALDYVELRGADELEPIDDAERIGERALLALAVFAGSTRLIDNVVLGEDGAATAVRP